jgi:hypothetical protein
MSRLSDVDHHVPLVRERWATIQSELFASAYQLAVEGKRLIDEGQLAAASQLLTDYMANNTRRMLSELGIIMFELEASKISMVL